MYYVEYFLYICTVHSAATPRLLSVSMCVGVCIPGPGLPGF